MFAMDLRGFKNISGMHKPFREVERGPDAVFGIGQRMTRNLVRLERCCRMPLKGGDCMAGSVKIDAE